MPNASDPPAIFLYEDYAALAREIVLAFEADGRTIALLATEADVVATAERGPSCVIVMDRMVRNVDSIAIVERLRNQGNRTPVIVISSLASVDERIKGLKSGGDDYLTKPFAMGELLARVDSLLRRAPDERQTTLTVDTLVMDVIERTVRRGDRPITMSPREFSLLEFFMRRPGQVLTRSMILQDVWKYKGAIDTNIVDVHIGHLRRKVDGAGDTALIRNKRGVGFVMTSGDV